MDKARDVVIGLLRVFVRAAKWNTVRGRWFRLTREEADVWCGIIIIFAIYVAFIILHFVLVISNMVKGVLP